jgi:GR25 family glycosyltransferase involved in LPS biosynthesis
MTIPLPFNIDKPSLEKVLERTKYRMDAYIISITNNHESTVATRRLMLSIKDSRSDINAFIYDAVIPRNLKENMSKVFPQSNVLPPISYTYPIEGSRFDMKSGMQLSAYPTAHLDKRISCFMSHYNLWLKCVKDDKPIMILEHDAQFTRRFEWDKIEDRFNGDILALNSPMGATRKATLYNEKVKELVEKKVRMQKKKSDVNVVLVPWIDDKIIPQGLPGNSAYIIKPAGAKKLIELTSEHGIWPNDALMCKQLMPGKLQQLYPFVTKVQKIDSHTSK